MGETQSRVLILAGTDRGDWGLGETRHTARVQGERLIHRTQRELAKRGLSDIWVVCPEHLHDLYAREGTPVVPQETTRHWIQEWDGSRHLWNTEGPTIIIYGDCYLSAELLDQISSDSGDPWHVYARWTPGSTKAYGEMFAWVFSNAFHSEFDIARQKAINAFTDNLTTRCLGWEVYRAILGIPLYENWLDTVHAVQIDDASEDFDDPADYYLWRATHQGLA